MTNLIVAYHNFSYVHKNDMYLKTLMVVNMLRLKKIYLCVCVCVCVCGGGHIAVDVCTDTWNKCVLDVQ